MRNRVCLDQSISVIGAVVFPVFVRLHHVTEVGRSEGLRE